MKHLNVSNKFVTCNLKKLLSILITFLPIIAFGQADSIFGTYVTATIGNSAIIKLFPDSTFSYQSPIDVGDVPETFGELKFSGDTVYFSYNQKIHPEITDSSSRFNPDNENLIIKINGNLNWYDNISLYVNEPFSDSGKIVAFDSNHIATLDSLKETDNLFIHVGMYSWTPISINFQENNEFNFQILLPPEQTIYFLTEKKALLKNGFMYFSMTENGIPYYNMDVYQKKRARKKIREHIWEKRREELNKNYR
jgi:hypothetical protein